MKRTGIWTAVLMLGVCWCGVSSEQTVVSMRVTSPTLREGQAMPAEHTADGRNVSPGLAWEGVPASAVELALVVTDEDHVWAVPTPVPMMHWVMFGIRQTVRELVAGMPTMEILPAPAELAGAFQAHTTFDVTGYRGPQPPMGQTHRYRFRILALDKAIELDPGAPASEVWKAIQGHIVGEGSLTVPYSRAPKRAKKPVV
jgi:Raf kinase inhibitor-like YbhB/YbcL family protein